MWHIARMTLAQILENTMYFIALLNPVSKVFFLASKKVTQGNQNLTAISLKSTMVSWIILVSLTCVGDFLLARIFHIEIYSLGVAGGIILFSIGLNAVKKGEFLVIDDDDHQECSDISIVPLATPLIAGPGTMTAAITLASIHGTLVTIVCITISLLINLGFMLLSYPISCGLEKLNATGTIIRIAGLIVTAVAMQMIFSGCAMWLVKVT